MKENVNRFKEDFDYAEQISCFAESILEKVSVSSDNAYGSCILAYYCKICMDFKSIIILLQKGFIDQAKVILRTMLEKLFILKGIIHDGNLKDYMEWNISAKKKIINNARQNYAGLCSIQEHADELEESVRKQAEDLGVEFDSKENHSTYKWAQKANMVEWNNLIYNDLSAIVHANDRIFENSTSVDKEGNMTISLLPIDDDTEEYLGYATEILLRAHKAIADHFGLVVPKNDYYEMLEIENDKFDEPM